MVHHRCTRCKQESYPRHPYKKSGVAGVYCDDCIKIVKFGEVRHHGGGWLGAVRGFFDRIRGWVHEVLGRPVSPKQAIAKKNREVHTRMKVMEAKARKIPSNPTHILPGKH